jgi:hypothetical protein
MMHNIFNIPDIEPVIWIILVHKRDSESM